MGFQVIIPELGRGFDRIECAQTARARNARQPDRRGTRRGRRRADHASDDRSRPRAEAALDPRRDARLPGGGNCGRGLALGARPRDRTRGPSVRGRGRASGGGRRDRRGPPSRRGWVRGRRRCRVARGRHAPSSGDPLLRWFGSRCRHSRRPGDSEGGRPVRKPWREPHAGRRGKTKHKSNHGHHGKGHTKHGDSGATISPGMARARAGIEAPAMVAARAMAGATARSTRTHSLDPLY
jgi:hypothetical protein